MSVPLGLRVSPEDVERLDALVSRIRGSSRHGLARAAMHVGLDLLELDPRRIFAPPGPVRQRQAYVVRKAQELADLDCDLSGAFAEHLQGKSMPEDRLRGLDFDLGINGWGPLTYSDLPVVNSAYAGRVEERLAAAQAASMKKAAEPKTDGGSV
ncbi:MAG: hypothetical protein HY828_01380 [Actinobacteria bacterium]|nr:hypothetical protein [Actinomycetota bacterium]